ncbi:hypothetical protein PAXRUDRAFT_832879, partial [Paxillus rubicundulus Ve08.2h10]
MRCDESPHGFRAGAATPRSWESGVTNSEVTGKRRYELRVVGKQKSGVGVPVPEITVFC